MSRRFDPEYLRRLRNEIAIDKVIRRLDWPHKHHDGEFRFLCPLCHEMRTATNPRTNLGRCFLCQRNFNPIDFVMHVQSRDFRTAVAILAPWLPPLPPPGTTPQPPADQR